MPWTSYSASPQGGRAMPILTSPDAKDCPRCPGGSALSRGDAHTGTPARARRGHDGGCLCRRPRSCGGGRSVECVNDKDLTPDLLDNVAEIFSVLASVFNTDGHPHVRRGEVYGPRRPRPEEVSQLAQGAMGRRELRHRDRGLRRRAARSRRALKKKRRTGPRHCPGASATKMQNGCPAGSA